MKNIGQELLFGAAIIILLIIFDISFGTGLLKHGYLIYEVIGFILLLGILIYGIIQSKKRKR